MSFLTAEWRKLVLANYEVDPETLRSSVPAGTELDLWDGSCLVSLVGFMFLNTRLMGIPIPFHTHFEEINLRFYVRYRDGGKWKRGVVFIREIVSKPALTFVANRVYGERYVTMPTRHSWSETAVNQEIEYSWNCRGEWQKLSVNAKTHSRPILDGSEEEFIAEHYWGYTQARPDTTFEYEVVHPRWETYPVDSFDIRVDFEKVYGTAFAALNGSSPVSVMLAEGSQITVEKKRKLPFGF